MNNIKTLLEEIKNNNFERIENLFNLHIHTTSSDGHLTPDEAIEFAKKLKKKHIDVVVNETKNTMHGFDIKNGKITRRVIFERMENIRKI